MTCAVCLPYKLVAGPVVDAACQDVRGAALLALLLELQKMVCVCYIAC